MTVTTPAAAAAVTAHDPIIQAPAVAELCGCPVGTVRYWDSIGKGPKSFRMGRRRVWRTSVVLAWIAEQENAA